MFACFFVLFVCLFVCWLVGWLVDWLIDCLFGRLVGWLALYWLVGRLVSWLVGITSQRIPQRDARRIQINKLSTKRWIVSGKQQVTDGPISPVYVSSQTELKQTKDFEQCADGLSDTHQPGNQNT